MNHFKTVFVTFLFPDVEVFSNLVQLLEIAADNDTITRLFEALTLRKTHGEQNRYSQ